MKLIFEKGDVKRHTFRVEMKDVAHFDQQKVHEVCATFTLAKEIEWCTRQFVLEMLEEEEEGIGTHLNIKHLSPALINQKVEIVGEFDSIEEGEIICGYEAKVGERIVAKGTTGQKILPKEKINKIFSQFA